MSHHLRGRLGDERAARHRGRQIPCEDPGADLVEGTRAAEDHLEGDAAREVADAGAGRRDKLGARQLRDHVGGGADGVVAVGGVEGAGAGVAGEGGDQVGDDGGGAVVEDVGSAEATTEIEVAGGRGGDDAVAGGDGELDRLRADAGGAAPYQEGFGLGGGGVVVERGVVQGEEVLLEQAGRGRGAA